MYRTLNLDNLQSETVYSEFVIDKLTLKNLDLVPVIVTVKTWIKIKYQ